MDLYKYRRKLNHDTAMESIFNTTKDIINNTFHEAPNYRYVFLNGVKTEARVDNESDETEKSILFRPDTKIYKGDIVELDGTHWLVNNTHNDSIYPTVYLDLCNEWLRWVDDKETTLAYPAVMRNKSFDLNEDKYVVFSEDTLVILAPYNQDTSKIKPLQRFIINDKPYKIEGVDAVSNVALGKGFIEFKAKLDLEKAEDNFEEDIATNEGSGWGEW